MAGIFITRGTAVTIPPGGLQLTLRDDGGLSNSATLHVRYDVCQTWLKLALNHLDAALTARAVRETAWEGSNSEEKARTLEAEFEASMQAIIAAVTALEAFYGIIQPHVAIPSEVILQWREQRTARYSQITEVLRRAFRLKPQGTAALRAGLKEIYRVRDRAVHPSGKAQPALYHPELGVRVEWRFAYFCAANADVIVNAVGRILWDLSQTDKASSSKISDYAIALKQRLARLFPTGRPTPTSRT